MPTASLTRSEVIDVVQRKLSTTEKSIHSDLRRGLSGLATIAATAPFVGLFGTTLGIVNSFNGIGLQKISGMPAVSQGISEALITTALGLLVAVPAAFAYNYFSTKLDFFDTENSLTADALVAALTSRMNRPRFPS